MSAVKPKLLIVFFQNDNKANGGVNSLIEIVRRLENFDPILLTQRKNHVFEYLREQNFKIICREIKWKGLYKFKLFAILEYNWWIIRNYFESAANAHVNDIQALQFTSIGLFLKGIKIHFNIRGVFSIHTKYRFHWYLVNLAKSVIVLSNEMEKELSKRLPIFKKRNKVSKICVVRSIVDFDRFCSQKLHWKLKEKLIGKDFKDRIHILIVGVFYDLKNQLAFIDNVIPKLKNKFFIHFVGDENNDYSNFCKLRVEDLKLSTRVRFHGYQNEIEHFFKIADLTVICSRREGLSRTMIESISCGVPVLSFDVCSANEILIQHNCGFVVKQGDYNSMAACINSIDINSKDFKKKIMNGMVTSRLLFDPNSVIQSYESIISNSGNRK